MVFGDKSQSGKKPIGLYLEEGTEAINVYYIKTDSNGTVLTGPVELADETAYPMGNAFIPAPLAA